MGSDVLFSIFGLLDFRFLIFCLFGVLIFWVLYFFMLLFLDFVYVVFGFFSLFGPNTLSLSDPISDALSVPIYDPISWQSGTRKWVRRHPWVGLATLSDCQNRPYRHPSKTCACTGPFWRPRTSQDPPKTLPRPPQDGPRRIRQHPKLRNLNLGCHRLPPEPLKTPPRPSQVHTKTAQDGSATTQS